MKQENHIDHLDFFNDSLYFQLLNYSEIEYQNKFKEHLSCALSSMAQFGKKQLEVSSIISGGIDSSIVSAVLAKQKIINSFYTLRFNEKDPVAEIASKLISKIDDNEECHNHFNYLCNIESYFNEMIRSIDLLSSPNNSP